MTVIVGEGGSRAVAEAAHTLKGSAAAIGAGAVARVAGQIETASGQENRREVDVLLATLREAVAAAGDAIARLRSHP
jgi:HPt (histidine-containing phosphotransfer) domain-containing protein